jgi:hypothetical protein
MGIENGENITIRRLNDPTDVDVVLRVIGADRGEEPHVGRPVRPITNIVGVPTSSTTPTETAPDPAAAASTDLPTVAHSPFARPAPAPEVVTPEGLFVDEGTGSNIYYKDSVGREDSRNLRDAGTAEAEDEEDESEEEYTDASGRRRLAGALLATTILLGGTGAVGYYEVTHDNSISAHDRDAASNNMPGAAASQSAAPDKQQHKHKHKPAPSASPSAEVKPTHTAAPTAEPIPEPTIDSLPTPVTAPVPTGPTTFRIGSLDLDPTAGNKNWQDDLAKSYHVISQHLDVAGIRLDDQVQWQRMQAGDMFGKDKQYGVFPDVYEGFAAHDSIVWDTNLFHAVDTMTLSGTHGPDTDTHPHAVSVVRLKSKETDEEFYVLNTTLPDGKTVDAYQAREDAATTLVDYATNLQSSEGVPVLILADMSDRIGRRQDMNGDYVKPDLANKPYCDLTGIGMLANAYAMAHSDGITPRDCARDDNMPPTQLWMTGNGAVQLLDYRTKIGPKRNGTEDSDLLEANISIPVPTAAATDFTTAVTGAS